MWRKFHGRTLTGAGRSAGTSAASSLWRRIRGLAMQQRFGNEDGAVLVFVALILVVVIGFGAIAVDAGALYQEHRELQNAADAAALAVAQSCSEAEVQTACAGGLSSVDDL